jgi:HEPN domain-containing protein
METEILEKRVSHWLEQAKEDLKTARIMFLTGRWKYSIFMCQQSVEKLLKSIYMKQKKEFPPRIHNLFRLSELIDKSFFSEDHLLFFSELSLYYIESRYPENLEKMNELNSRVKAKEILKKTREVTKWLRKTKL